MDEVETPKPNLFKKVTQLGKKRGGRNSTKHRDLAGRNNHTCMEGKGFCTQEIRGQVFGERTGKTEGQRRTKKKGLNTFSIGWKLAMRRLAGIKKGGEKTEGMEVLWAQVGRMDGIPEKREGLREHGERPKRTIRLGT